MDSLVIFWKIFIKSLKILDIFSKISFFLIKETSGGRNLWRKKPLEEEDTLENDGLFFGGTYWTKVPPGEIMGGFFMQKIRHNKFMAMLLTLVMALSLLSVTAFAEDGAVASIDGEDQTYPSLQAGCKRCWRGSNHQAFRWFHRQWCCSSGR